MTKYAAGTLALAITLAGSTVVLAGNHGKGALPNQAVAKTEPPAKAMKKHRTHRTDPPAAVK